ncbi:hypothetical protein GXP70_00565 [Paenibacillus lycopersici]|uniref:Uncharacterized protein n=1 Tax=Paenibacillus lycopersici TaxID=2704462 RepID=A0A6C0FUM2_9BACL|nr:hypothetical protein [Paenibacillus lycopersici]QHT58619.1 hypothetical protein GXP70_00565 [Paenibacillus lycopersici]
MKEGQFLKLGTKARQYINFKSKATGQSISLVVEDLIERDMILNYEVYTRMEEFFKSNTDYHSE